MRLSEVSTAVLFMVLIALSAFAIVQATQKIGMEEFEHTWEVGISDGSVRQVVNARCYVDTGGIFSGGSSAVICRNKQNDIVIFRDAVSLRRIK